MNWKKFSCNVRAFLCVHVFQQAYTRAGAFHKKIHKTPSYHLLLRRFCCCSTSYDCRELILNFRINSIFCTRTRARAPKYLAKRRGCCCCVWCEFRTPGCMMATRDDDNGDDRSAIVAWTKMPVKMG